MCRVVRAVLLDAGGTLIHPTPSVAAIYAQVATEVGAHLPVTAFDGPFRRSFRSWQRALAAGEPLAGSTSAAGDRSMWQGIVGRMLLEMGPVGQRLLESDWFDRVYARFHQARSWAPYPETRDALERLRARGCRLVVVSNFGPYLGEILEGLELAGYFDAIVISARVGLRKPDAGIFRAALAAVGVAAADAVHVGDAPVEDVEGAARAGLRGILLDRSGSGGEAGGAVKTLIELCEALEDDR